MLEVANENKFHFDTAQMPLNMPRLNEDGLQFINKKEYIRQESEFILNSVRLVRQRGHVRYPHE